MNQLSGSIPTEISNLTFGSDFLYLENNCLTTTDPTVINFLDLNMDPDWTGIVENQQCQANIIDITATTANGTYMSGNTINITIQFDKIVNVTGTPQLTLETGTIDAVVDYSSGSGTDTLTFTYTVASGDISSDLDYANTTALSLNSGTIQDGATNDAVLTLPTPGTAGSLGVNKAIIVDSIAATIIDITATTANGTYISGNTINITIQFDKVVNVTGTPQLTLETGTTDAVVDYSSGSGTDTLTFTYTVASGDISSDLDYVSTTALSLNSGTIQDNATNDAVLTLPTPGTAGSLGVNKDLIIGNPVPDDPTNLTGTAISDTQINLSWTDNSDNETGFKIERNGSLIATTSANSTNYSDNNLICETNYNYSVTATNDNGDSSAVSTTATTLECLITVYYKLTINKTGNGNIVPVEYGIDCGDICEYEYQDQTELSLIAIPDNGWIFTGWGGDCDSNGEININAEKTCNATFVQPKIEISTTTINLTEGISSDGYSLWLNLPPTEPVTITLVGDDDLILQPSLLTFDSTNWNIPQTVQITDINDDFAEGLHNHTISHTITTDDENFNGLTIADITVQITDDDGAGVHISTYDITVNEGNTNNSYNITLTSQPTNDVTVVLTTSSNAYINQTTLVFSVENWNIPQDIIVSVDDDKLAEGKHQHEPIHHQITSEDSSYNNLATNDVTVHVIDNDIGGISLSSNVLNLNEGDVIDLKIVLNSAPNNLVTINLTPESGITVSPATLSFGVNNWDIAQTVTVIAIDDKLITNEIRTILVNSTSSDINYNAIEVENITVKGNDNDKPTIQLSTNQVTVLEEGIGDSYTLILTFAPTHPVTVTLTTSEHTQVSPNTVVFTLNNWDVKQTIEVIAINDDLVEEDTHINTITHKVTSDDTNYNNLLISNVTVNIVDSVNKLDLGEIVDEEILEILPEIIENLPEGITINEITLEEPEVVNTTGLPSNCNVRDDSIIISAVCDVEQQIFPEKVEIINDISSISNAIFEDDVKNAGLIANSTIEEDATLTGGSLSGTINNEGNIEDIKFVGSELSGGTLSGHIVNESQVGGVIKDVYLSIDTVLQNGKTSGRITGEITEITSEIPVITGVKIMPGTHLSHLHLSPTVKLGKNVILGEGVTKATEPYTPQDFGLDTDDISKLDNDSFSYLEPEALATFSAEDVATIPPKSMNAMRANQIATMNSLDGVTKEQFTEIPTEALQGLTSDNMGDFSIEVVNELTPEHVDALNPKSFQEMPDENISKILINCDAEKITPKQMERVVPKDWQVDMKTGDLTPPTGAKLTPPLLPEKSLENLSLPEIADLNAGIGICGIGDSIKDEMEASLEEQELPNIALSQDNNRILTVNDTTDNSDEAKYAFIPDADSVIQVDVNELDTSLNNSTDLTFGTGGFRNITTLEGQQYKLVPAPKDPIALAETTDSEVIVGKRGDVMMKHSNRTRSTEVYEIAIFDPFVEDFAPDNLCIEIFPGELECDGDLRRRSSRAKTRKIQYPDGTAQTIRPTVLSPDVFIEEALKFEGVEQVVYKADGTFAVLYQGKSYFVHPNFTVQNERISEPVEPSIVSNSDGSIRYSIAIETETNTRSTEVYEMLFFDLFLEAAPDDLCIEIIQGELECDF
ncbi:fibronectin type III domain-containing protein [Candidatus Halobeggiatoa sp. HSG11]|nr:fibronectin type III domain-containing protein [Candidatus Halobeggiatoa sp. HSG11]